MPRLTQVGGLFDGHVVDGAEVVLCAGVGAGMMAPAAQSRGGVVGVNAGGGGGHLDPAAAGAPALSNLETIIAATVRAVTGQLGGLDGGAVDGSMLRRHAANPAAAGGGMEVPGAAAAVSGGPFARWHAGVDGGGGWAGAEAGRRPAVTGMPSADAVRSGMLASDNDPNTLSVSYTHLTLPTIYSV